MKSLMAVLLTFVVCWCASARPADSVAVLRCEFKKLSGSGMMVTSPEDRRREEAPMSRIVVLTNVCADTLFDLSVSLQSSPSRVRLAEFLLPGERVEHSFDRTSESSSVRIRFATRSELTGKKIYKSTQPYYEGIHHISK